MAYQQQIKNISINYLRDIYQQYSAHQENAEINR